MCDLCHSSTSQPRRQRRARFINTGPDAEDAIIAAEAGVNYSAGLSTAYLLWIRVGHGLDSSMDWIESVKIGPVSNSDPQEICGG